MDYLLDTNIVLAYVRQDKIIKQIDKKYNPLGKNNASIISAVTVGEINSILCNAPSAFACSVSMSNGLSCFLIPSIKIYG